MNKKERLQLIIEMVSQYQIDTQDEIVNRLLASGVQATQATVSRDIKALGIVKVPTAESGYIYGLPKGANKILMAQLRHVLSCQWQEQMIHVAVEPGTTAIVKRQLSETFQESIFSIVGDDDSLLVVAKTGVDVQLLARQIEEL